MARSSGDSSLDRVRPVAHAFHGHWAAAMAPLHVCLFYAQLAGVP